MRWLPSHELPCSLSLPPLFFSHTCPQDHGPRAHPSAKSLPFHVHTNLLHLVLVLLPPHAGHAALSARKGRPALQAARWTGRPGPGAAQRCTAGRQGGHGPAGRGPCTPVCLLLVLACPPCYKPYYLPNARVPWLSNKLIEAVVSAITS